MLRAILSALLAVMLLLSCACADGIGISYDEFMDSYTQNVLFINDNTGRYLLPHSPVREYDAQGRRIWRVNKGSLAFEMHMDESNFQVVRCVITLTAPEGLKQGTVQYNDFATAGYHSYAMLMAFSPADTPAERYAVVEAVNEGLKATGAFAMEVGDYHLDATNAYGAATIRLQNAFLMDDFMQETPQPAEGEPEVEIHDGTEDEDSLAG